MNATDLKYAGILSTRLERYSVKENAPYRANFRCPICGDSQKSKTKARGWILEKDNSAITYCHNCNASHGMRNFLKIVDHNLYNEYIIDTALDKKARRELFNPHKEDIKPLDKLIMKAPNFKKKGSHLLKIDKVSSLPIDHKAKMYIQERQIPSSTHYKLYYAPKFNEWVNSIIPGKLPTPRPPQRDGPRLVMPFIDKDGNLFGFNARSFSESSGLRYITIMIDEDMPKIFGLDSVNFKKKYYVIEGPIDSLFIDNSVAMAGADGKASGLKSTENAVFVFDNEPRNKEIVSRMEKCLDNGFSVCLWPERLIEKDINDMILSGLSSDYIKNIIDEHTYSGLEGKLHLTIWKRC